MYHHKQTEMDNRYLLTQQEARSILSDFAPQFFMSIRGGFEDFQKVNDYLPVFENTTKAILVWEYVIQRIKKVVAENPDRLRFRKKKRMFMITIDSKMAVKFKKFNNKLLSSNIQTDQVTDFRGHTYKLDNQEIFPVEAGWRIDEFYSTIIDVHFVSPDGQKKNLWKIQYRPSDNSYSELISPEEKDVLHEQIVKLNNDEQNAKEANQP